MATCLVFVLAGALAGAIVSLSWKAMHPSSQPAPTSYSENVAVIHATPEELCADIPNPEARAQCERGE